jgi:hypothetical protein
MQSKVETVVFSNDSALFARKIFLRLSMRATPLVKPAHVLWSSLNIRGSAAADVIL